MRVAREGGCRQIRWDERPYDADALITNVPNLPLFAYGTDCCMMRSLDPTSRSIAAIHAGWRGTASGIVLKALVTMMSLYGADPYTMRAAIGPAIGKCCFETDGDVADAFHELMDPAVDERIERRGDKYHIDLKSINRLWLLRSGLDPSRIDVHPDCTKCRPDRYWSRTGRAWRHGGGRYDGGRPVTRRLTALALALVLALSLTGCWEAEPEPDDFWNDDPSSPTEETPRREPAQISDFTLPYLSGQTFDPVACIDGVQQTVGDCSTELPLFARPPFRLCFAPGDCCARAMSARCSTSRSRSTPSFAPQPRCPGADVDLRAAQRSLFRRHSPHRERRARGLPPRGGVRALRRALRTSPR